MTLVGRGANLTRMFPCIKPFVSPLQCSLALLALTVLPLRAQTAVTEKDIEVSNVHFNMVPPPAGSTTKTGWCQVDVEVNVKPGAATQATHSFLNRVKVTLSLAFHDPTEKDALKFSYYRASAEVVALEVGRSNLRFYLPGEIIKRDSLAGEAKYYAVELAVGGKAIPMKKGNGYSEASLPDLEHVQNFLTKAGAESAANDGSLLPQYLTGYANDNSRPSPTIVRPEAVGK